jgi:hypothetical protein
MFNYTIRLISIKVFALLLLCSILSNCSNTSYRSINKIYNENDPKSLVKYLKNSDPTYRLASLERLGYQKDLSQDTLDAIFSCIEQDDEKEVRKVAYKTLSNSGEKAKPFVSKILNLIKKMKSKSEKRSAHLALAKITNNKQFIALAHKDYINSSFSEASYALRELEKIGSEAKPVFNELVKLLDDKSVISKNTENYCRASIVLGSIGPESMPYLLGLLNDNSHYGRLREYGAVGLEKMGHAAAPAIPELVKVSKTTKDKLYYYKALRAIIKSYEDVPQLFKEYLTFQDTNIYKFELHNVFTNVTDTLIPKTPEIINALKNSPPIDKENQSSHSHRAAESIKSSYIYMLGEIGESHKDGVPALIEAYSNYEHIGSHSFICIIRNALIKTESKKVIPTLQKALKHPYFSGNKSHQRYLKSAIARGRKWK